MDLIKKKGDSFKLYSKMDGA